MSSLGTTYLGSCNCKHFLPVSQLHHVLRWLEQKAASKHDAPDPAEQNALWRRRFRGNLVPGKFRVQSLEVQ